MNALKVFLVVALLLLVTIIALYSHYDTPVKRGAGPKQFTIGPGETAASVGMRLKSENLIRSAFLFKFLASVNGLDGKIRAGRYALSPAMGTQEILFYLVSHNEIETEVKVTIPEGFTAREIAARMDARGLCPEDEWMNIVKNPGVYNINTRDHALGNLEGFLFPDTYFFRKAAPCGEHVQKMVSEFFKVFTRKALLLAESQGFSLVEIVTLASLIEKEAQVDEERVLISSVLRNRLRKGMLLQCDATILHALPERKKRVLYEDLEIDSPYNTYKYKGLPPGPIGSPGAKSLAAALKPADSPYYYYVATGDGGHLFTRTSAEHSRAVMKTRPARMKQLRDNPQ